MLKMQLTFAHNYFFTVNINTREIKNITATRYKLYTSTSISLYQDFIAHEYGNKNGLSVW